MNQSLFLDPLPHLQNLWLNDGAIVWAFHGLNVL